MATFDPQQPDPITRRRPANERWAYRLTALAAVLTVLALITRPPFWALAGLAILGIVLAAIVLALLLIPRLTAPIRGERPVTADPATLPPPEEPTP